MIARLVVTCMMATGGGLRVVGFACLSVCRSACAFVQRWSQGRSVLRNLHQKGGSGLLPASAEAGP